MEDGRIGDAVAQLAHESIPLCWHAMHAPGFERRRGRVTVALAFTSLAEMRAGE